jgi:hypothetical protein
VVVAVRPEHLHLGPARAGENAVELKVRDPVFLGSKLILHFHAAEGDHVVAELAVVNAQHLAPGDNVTVSWDIGATLLYPVSAR